MNDNTLEPEGHWAERGPVPVGQILSNSTPTIIVHLVGRYRPFRVSRRCRSDSTVSLTRSPWAVIYLTHSLGLHPNMHRTTSLLVTSLLIALCAILATKLHLRDMPTLAATRASNANYKPTYRPVGLFFGGYFRHWSSYGRKASRTNGGESTNHCVWS